jgi:hypothetical protein
VPDVFEVLRQDHEEVKTMLARLEDGPKAWEGATGEQLAERKRLADDMIIEASKHEAAEQQYFWPAFRAAGPAGDRIADLAAAQEQVGEQVLHGLVKLGPDEERFEELLAEYAALARAHIEFEEEQAWPLLRAMLSAEQAADLGGKITATRQLAPTRPNPVIPPDDDAVKTAGPVAGLADRLRDVVTGRGRRS